MSKGFAVQPDKLKAFQNDVRVTADSYSLIVDQLNEARLCPTDTDPTDKMHGLLGAPERLGPSGPPVDFTNASRTMLANYDSLLDTLADVHAAIHARFKYMDDALGETHDSYKEEVDQLNRMITNLIGRFNGDPDIQAFVKEYRS
ncbi:hypothetical protein [Actinophytocola gossypii]|uniref:Uncharacterized protein n=1 Tax=Actinophytocola gossypii TaxID=2812003 RepID=A0ABT2JGS6_9PSEU|nr:hypothetical protein [Actinophytocola gossypii]MCT2586729.1 hypothetical protein [Actinophytocola gossypii]